MGEACLKIDGKEPGERKVHYMIEINYCEGDKSGVGNETWSEGLGGCHHNIGD